MTGSLRSPAITGASTSPPGLSRRNRRNRPPAPWAPDSRVDASPSRVAGRAGARSRDRVARPRGSRHGPRRRQGRVRRRCAAGRAGLGSARAAKARFDVGANGRGPARESPRVWFRVARISASAADARSSTSTPSRRSRSSSASSRSAMASRARPTRSRSAADRRPGLGLPLSAPGCRCVTSSRRAACWWVSTRGGRASSPTCANAT